MIKGKPSYPFHTIGLAVSFSPGLEFLIRETKRLCDVHAAMAVFIHAGKKTGEKFRELSSLLNSAGFHDGNSRIYWEQGTPVNSVLQTCKNEVVDLLIVGASDRSEFSGPAGSFTREIASRAKCSLLIYAGKESSFRRLVVNGNDHRKTNHSILTTFYMADAEHSEEIIIAEDSETGDSFTVATQTGLESLPAEIRNAIGKLSSEVRLMKLTTEGTGNIADFAFRKGADLLVVNSNDHHLRIFDRIFSNEIDSIIKALPCNLLIVHSRLPED